MIISYRPEAYKIARSLGRAERLDRGFSDEVPHKVDMKCLRPFIMAC